MSKKELKFCNMPIHVCEKIPIHPGIQIFPIDTKVCPYCGEKLKKDDEEEK